MACYGWTSTCLSRILLVTWVEYVTSATSSGLGTSPLRGLSRVCTSIDPTRRESHITGSAEFKFSPVWSSSVTVLRVNIWHWALDDRILSWESESRTMWVLNAKPFLGFYFLSSSCFSLCVILVSAFGQLPFPTTLGGRFSRHQRGLTGSFVLSWGRLALTRRQA